jgi:hypothetical protein
MVSMQQRNLRTRQHHLGACASLPATPRAYRFRAIPSLSPFIFLRF